MMRGPAAADAVARARRLPSLRVGLHLVLCDGVPMLAAASVPGLVDLHGRFRSDMATLGLEIFARPGVRKQVAAEIEAQFAAFRATGLALDHVNAHHHFHVHPTIAALVLDIGQRYGMRAVRVPAERTSMLDRIEPSHAHRPDWRSLPFVSLLAAHVRRRGLFAPDQVFGVAWSGAMTTERVAGVLEFLPDGISELYLHPATSNGFAGAAHGYRYADELAALIAPDVKERLRASGAKTGGFADFADA